VARFNPWMRTRPLLAQSLRVTIAQSISDEVWWAAFVSAAHTAAVGEWLGAKKALAAHAWGAQRAGLYHVGINVHLTPDEAEAYYDEMALVAGLFGLPRPAIPSTLVEFREYVDAQLARPELCVTAPAREVAAVILEAPVPAPLRPVIQLHRLATAALLPPKLRKEYGLPWSRAHATSLALAAPSLRVLAVPLFHLAGRVSSSRSLV
jgi:hypothetical protein